MNNVKAASWLVKTFFRTYFLLSPLSFVKIIRSLKVLHKFLVKSRFTVIFEEAIENSNVIYRKYLILTLF